MSEFGARERLTAEPSKENGWLMFKNLKLPDGFWGEFFLGKIWSEGFRQNLECVTFF